jgi:galactosamine-6-phosphate isomerase/glucosamine-6-phosphate deaminase
LLQPTTVSSAQKYFKGNVILKEGITLGLRHFMEARIPILIASGAKKAGIISKALTHPVSNMIPATIIQSHPDSLVFLDEEAASQLPEYA